MTTNPPADQSGEPIPDRQAAIELLEEIRARSTAHEYVPLDISPTGPVASVLIPVYEKDGRLHVILTKRSNRVQTQQGQISFPGGMVEPDDADLSATALREAMEEIGLNPDHVELLGRVDDFFTRNGEVHVAGYVGIIRPNDAPYPWVPSVDEVAEILEVPLEHLFDEANIVRGPERETNGQMWRNETFNYEGHEVFGATARALRNFLDINFPDGLPAGSTIKVDIEVPEEKSR